MYGSWDRVVQALMRVLVIVEREVAIQAFLQVRHGRVVADVHVLVLHTDAKKKMRGMAAEFYSLPQFLKRF